MFRKSQKIPAMSITRKFQMQRPPRIALRKNFFQPLATGGNTSLHNIVRSYQDMDAFHQRIKQWSKPELLKMSLVVNNEGNTPLDLVSTQGAEPLRKFLFDILATQKFPSLADPVTMINPGIPSERLHKALQIGKQIATAARKIIVTSSTHPQTNHLSYAESLEVEKQINNTMLWLSFEPRSSDVMENHALTATEFKAGNCQHFSALACYLLQKLQQNYEFAIYGISNGNHVFAVINEINARKESAVIVDAWAGTVFPLKNIKNLGVYKYYTLNEAENGLRTICTYNPNFHSFQTYYSTFKQSPELENCSLRC